MYVSRDRGTRNCEFSGASEGGRGQIKGAHYLSSTWLRSTVDDGLESRGKFRSNKASSTLQNLGASQSGLRVLFGETQASRDPSALPLCSEARRSRKTQFPRRSGATASLTRPCHCTKTTANLKARYGIHVYYR